MESYTFDEMLDYAILEFEKYNITFKIVDNVQLFVIDEFYMQQVTYFGRETYQGRLEFYPFINKKVFQENDFSFYRKGRQERLEFPFKSDIPIDLEIKIKKIVDSFHVQYEIFKGDLRKYIHENTKVQNLKWFKTDEQFEMMSKYVFDDQTNAEAYFITNNEKFLSKEAQDVFIF